MATLTQSMRCKSDKIILERCMKTIHEMLQDRGFDPEKIGLLQRSDTEWCIQPFEWNTETHGSLAEHQLQSIEPLFVSSPTETVVVIAYWKPFIIQHDLFKEIQFLFESDIPPLTIQDETLTTSSFAWPPQHIILITCSPLRTSDIRDLQPFQKKVRIEMFHQGEIEFNRTHHELVPQHRKLSTEEAVLLLHNLNTSPHQCPKLLITDIICRYYGGKIGDLFEIKRIDQTTGDMEITFRIVTST